MNIGLDVAQTCVERAGCGWYADSLARALVATAPDNEYQLYHHFGGWFNERTDAGTHLDAPNVHEPLRDLGIADAAALWRRVAAGEIPLPGEPDIVHASSFQAPYVGRARLVFTVHDVSFWTHPDFTTDGNRLLCQDGAFAALERADGFLFVSDNSHLEFDRLLPGWLKRRGRPWAVIHHGSRERPAETVVPATGSGEFWLAVGTLEPRKNYETLLDALDLYWTRSASPWPLRIAGGGGWKSETLKEHLSAQEAAGRVQRLGYVPDEELARLYAGAYGFVFPSWHEGFGLPVLEALGYGTPVICSDRASLPEVGGDAAVYVDPSSAEAICQAMLDLEADPTRRAALAEAGRRQAARFSWERTARATLEFYGQVLESRA